LEIMDVRVVGANLLGQQLPGDKTTLAAPMSTERLVGEPGIQVQGKRAALQRLQRPHIERDRVGDDRIEELLAEFNPAPP
jgi:hypothetical protein